MSDAVLWGDKFPATFDAKGNRSCILVGNDGSSLPISNEENFTYTNGMYSLTIQKNPNSKAQEFYNQGTITASEVSLSIDMLDVDFFLMEGASYKTTDAGLTLNGKDFYSQGGSFEIGKENMNLNFGDFINMSGTTKISLTGDASMFIRLTGDFSNQSKLLIEGEKKAFIRIQGGDFYNGVNHSSGQTYFSGSLILNNTRLFIEKNLYSEGVDDSDRSKIEINNDAYLSISGNLYNGPYSDIINNGFYLSVSGDLNNQGNMYIKGLTYIAGNFISQAGSKLYFIGSDNGTSAGRSLNANAINIKGALVYFLKGTAPINIPYYFLTSTNGSVQYDATLLGKQDVLSEDGSINEFYEAIVETSSDSVKTLKVTFKIKENNNISNQGEINIINIFGTQNPIPGFDIKNLSMNQIRKISKNINDGLEYYSHHKDTSLHSGFEAIKANVFSRMIGEGRGISTFNNARSSLLPYNPSAHYASNDDNATNTINAFKQAIKTQKSNNLYMNVLGSFQSFSEGYGYNYGLSVGYDRNFDDKLFVGAYLAYVGGKQNFDVLSTLTQGFEMGLYGRFNTSILETDVVFNQGYAYNKSTKTITILSDTYNTHSNYGSNMFNILFQTGPKFIFGKNSIKPYFGLSLDFYTGNDITEDSNTFASSYHFKDSLYVGQSIGIEYKRILKNGYIFIKPSYEGNIFSNNAQSQVVFLNNTISIATSPKEKFASLLLGGETVFNHFLLLNASLSTKFSNQKTFIATGMLSLKYVF
ncbi:hypothetical protein BKH42_04060 [Helicobacter sp. 13S00482-2]|uniref:autotransporter outer membrane beta-barrel domain-containing protein n=1 Tax=Helicobacter sp. 13S00482-2 TaxID=1476200 RepID=UPI000BA73D85|nr:autotransporter outer membrane beta-barrel domain-containing protein [Helicobacter sp. 13S00482-2]PAF53915.1 hypothetical protein BKH42_04060 [Helicobacter sp. 13S00482-2]